MRSTLTVGRLCLRQALRIRPVTQCRAPVQTASRRSYRGGNGWGGSHWKQPPSHGRTLIAAAVSLSPAAFVTLSEEGSGHPDQTAEGRMLEASRDEIEKKVDEDARGYRRFRRPSFSI